jgi:hypothetical protein
MPPRATIRHRAATRRPRRCATAEAIPGARFLSLPGGHVLPPAAWRDITAAVVELAR